MSGTAANVRDTVFIVVFQFMHACPWDGLVAAGFLWFHPRAATWSLLTGVVIGVIGTGFGRRPNK
jgi:hypothetical protein